MCGCAMNVSYSACLWNQFAPFQSISMCNLYPCESEEWAGGLLRNIDLTSDWLRHLNEMNKGHDRLPSQLYQLFYWHVLSQGTMDHHKEVAHTYKHTHAHQIYSLVFVRLSGIPSCVDNIMALWTHTHTTHTTHMRTHTHAHTQAISILLCM